MHRDAYAQIERQIESFPPLPTTVTRVLQVTGDPESSAADLMEAIQSDQSICTALLKVANSALFGHPKTVSSLEKAITILGFEEVESIVLSKAVISTFMEKMTPQKGVLDRFWEHSFIVGLAGKIMAVHLGLPSGQFFMGGLIHDIGKLALLLCFPEDYTAPSWLARFSTEARLKEERRLFGIGHELVAGKLLQSWNFPAQLLLALGYHHSPGKAPQSHISPLVIQLADLFAYFCCDPTLLDDLSVTQAIQVHLPEIESLWQSSGLQWDETAVESWFAWLKIDAAYGSSILKVLISRK